MAIGIGAPQASTSGFADLSSSTEEVVSKKDTSMLTLPQKQPSLPRRGPTVSRLTVLRFAAVRTDLQSLRATEGPR